MSVAARSQRRAESGRAATVTTRRAPLWWLSMRLAWPRYVLALVGVITIFRGVVGMVAPSPPRPRQVIERVASSADPAAEGLAVRFVRDYLSYSSQSQGQRERALAGMVGGPLDQDAGFSAPGSGSERVIAAQVIADTPVGGGAHRYTVMASTTRAGTVYLAVTVGHDARGALELVGAPAFVGAPSTAPAVDDPSEPGQVITDGRLTAVISRALRNYLAGATGQLQADVLPGVTVHAPALRLRLVQVERIAWTQQNRLVGVDLRAADRTGATYELHYDVGVTDRDRWFVTSIEGQPTHS